MNYLPPLPESLKRLPFELNEITFYLLSFAKTCSHCGEALKGGRRTQVYYDWRMRFCEVCSTPFQPGHELTMDRSA
jgi:hypothetical protein